MKLWFALEGSCEINFVKYLIQRQFPNISIETDEVRFIKSRPRKNKAIAYLVNYGGEGSIPYGINEDYGRILESNYNWILIVGDVEENLKRPRYRKKFILDKLDQEVDRNKILYVFSCPYLEEIYWDHPDSIMDVLKVMFLEKFSDGPLPNFIIPRRPSSGYKHHLRKIWETYNLRFRGVEISQLFFSKFQYQSSNNHTVQRLLTLLQNI